MNLSLGKGSPHEQHEEHFIRPGTEEAEGLGLELTGVELTDRGYIKVNERLVPMETNLRAALVPHP